MAADKKQEKELSVEERLKALYQLQNYLSEIDRIKTLRGELPNEVKDREDEIARYQTRIAKHEEEIIELKRLVSSLEGQIADRKQTIARYEEQMNDVTNNRQYVYLEKEKEFEGLEIELAQKNIREAKANQERKLQDIQHDKECLADNEHILEQKKQELEDIVNETRKEEEDILMKTKELEPLIDPYTLAAFKRIRKNARNGLGIVSVQRSACGGCFNQIPAQRQLEIRMRKKVIVCEYCGRILIDSSLAGIEETEVKTAPEKKTTRRTKKSAQA